MASIVLSRAEELLGTCTNNGARAGGESSPACFLFENNVYIDLERPSQIYVKLMFLN